MPLSTVANHGLHRPLRGSTGQPARGEQFTAEVTVATVDDADLIPAERLCGEPSIHVAERILKPTERGVRGGVLVHDHEQIDKTHGLAC